MTSMTGPAVQPDLWALAQRFIDDVINAQDLDGALVEMVAEDFVELNPLPGQGPRPGWPGRRPRHDVRRLP